MACLSLSVNQFFEERAEVVLHRSQHLLSEFGEFVTRPFAHFASFSIRSWNPTTLRERLVKIGAKVVRHAKYVVFQLAEVAIPRQLFARILGRIARLSPACASG
jgi:hypothetical protein